MDNKELLRRAAKAVNGGAWHPLTHEKPWNPLDDDGDALRLLGSAGLLVDCSIPGVVQCAGPRGIATEERYIELAAENQRAATRRAIVRAAAALGGKE